MACDGLRVFVEVHLSHEAAVQPAQLLLVEDRARTAHVGDVEALDQLLGAEDRRVVLRAPAEQSEVVPHGGGHVAGVAELLDARRAVALGELLPVRAVQQRQVRVAGRRDPQRIHHEQLLGRVGEVVVAPDHVGYPHVGVVDRDGEVVENRAIATSDHEVVLGLIGEAHLPPDLVGDNGVALIRYPETHGRVGFVRGLTAIAAVAVLLLPRRDVIAGGRVAIRRSRLEQPLERLMVAIRHARTG